MANPKYILPRGSLRYNYINLELSMSDIAKIYGCSGAVVFTNLHKYNISIRGKEAIHTASADAKRSKGYNVIQISKPELSRLYITKKMPATKIAQKYSCSPGQVKTLLLKYNIAIRSRPTYTITYKDLQEKYINQQLSLVDIAKEYNCNPQNIWGRLIRYKIPLRSSTATVHSENWWDKQKHRRLFHIKQKDLQHQYITLEMSLNDIAKKIGCSHTILTRRANEFGIPIRDDKSKMTCRVRETLSIQQTGANNNNWKGGTSFIPYPIDFNYSLKRKIREKDNHTCQLCKITEIEYQRKLSIHHINYRRTDCREINLISLCGHCNSSVNSNRTFWQIYFTILNILNRWLRVTWSPSLDYILQTQE